MKLITRLSVIGLLLFRMISLSSCANIIPPGGGPRDTLSPVLLIAAPKDSAVNIPVTTKQMVLTFDEFVMIENSYTNLIVSPTLKNQPLVEGRLRNVTIRLSKDTLEPNTTYAFDFGNAVKDVNEGNIARGFRYVFSTGSTIDANTYSGKVLLAETGKPDSTLFVILHRNLSDSAVVKESPRYYARINGLGEFTFQNLPAGQFAVYVIGPNAIGKRYTDSTLMFAFRGSPVRISAGTPEDTLYAFAYKREQQQAGNIIPSVRPPAAQADRRLRYSPNLDNGQHDILRDLTLTFLRKLSVFDSAKFVLTDTNYRKLPAYSVSIDSAKTKIGVRHTWKENTPYYLLVARDAVADSLGTTLSKADTIRFYTKRESEYGSIRIRFTNIDLSRNPILQFVQENSVVDSFPVTRPEIYRKLYRPGSYEMRILYDTNGNGVWDPGSFRYKRQPEIVISLSGRLTIRANWENEATIPL
jgi:hypothetical protein